MKIEGLKKGQKILVECEFDSFAGANQAWVLLQGEPELAQLDDIKPNQLKPVVPKFVADWYEENKDDSEEFIFDLVDKMSIGWFLGAFDDWSRDAKNKPIQTLINMHQFGYTVEKEKLYTVEIPNPNSGRNNVTILTKNHENKVIIVCHVKDNWKNSSHNQLTEAEIRKDFDWAWEQGFAKEVTE